MEQASSQVVNTNATVINSTTLLASPSKSNKVEAKKVALIGKVPVIISEADVQIYVDATIQLDEHAIEITKVKKNVYLTRSQLLMTDDKKSAKLMLSGFVRKNIQYSTAKNAGNACVSGDIKFTVVNIPFKCFTKVDFLVEPETSVNSQVFTSSSVSSDGLGSDEHGLTFTNSEILNEKVFCQLLEAKIRDIDFKREGEHVCSGAGKFAYERTFKTISDSMIIELKIRVLQNQIVHISPPASDGQQSGGKSGEEKGGNSGSSKQEGSGKEGSKQEGSGKESSGKGGNKGNAKESGKNEQAVDNAEKAGDSGEPEKGKEQSDKEKAADEPAKEENEASEKKDKEKEDKKDDK